MQKFTTENKEGGTQPKWGPIVIVVLIVLAVLIVIFNSFTVVNEGFIGVKYQFGKIVGQNLSVLPALWALNKRFQEINSLDNIPAVTMCKEEKIMLLVNIDYIPGKEFEVLGMAKGTVVQSKNFGKDFMAGMKTLVGGEITGYTEMLNEARQIAAKRMVDEAEALGADAVINVRYGSSAVMQGAAEVIAYGTAVRFK